MKFLTSSGSFQTQSGLAEAYRRFLLPNPFLSQSFTDIDPESVSASATSNLFHLLGDHTVGKKVIRPTK